MDKEFFSRENYITLKEIIVTSTGLEFNKDKERQLYENMVRIFDSNSNVSNFHELNKLCINIYTNKFERQIPKNENPIENKNIINPVSDITPVQENLQNPENYDNITPEFKEEDTNDLFSKMKLEREKNLNIEDNDENVINSTMIDESLIQDESNSIFNDEDNFDNVIIKNSIDSTNFDYNTTYENNVYENTDTDEEIIRDTLNPYSLMKEKTYNYIEKEIFVLIDSKDRNLELYPNPNNFQVKFGGKPDYIEIPTRLDSDGSIIHDNAVLYKGYNGANINMELKNIKYIQLISVTVPYIPIYYNGNPPVIYTDKNQTNTPSSNLLDDAYIPEYISGSGSITTTDPTNSTGIPLDILEEPYLLIYIDEINTQHYYRSTNTENDTAFSRVINPTIISFQSKASFAIFEPQSQDERMKYEPTLLSSIDKMTLHIKDENNIHMNFGRDKLYVKEIKKSDAKIINKCFSLNSEYGTDIVITTNHKDYKINECENTEINHHGLKPGDTIYFYDTKPCNNEHIYKLNKNQTEGKLDISDNTISIKYKYKKNNKVITQKTLSLSKYLFVGDFISINGMIFKIKNFNGKKAIIESNDINRNNITSNITINKSTAIGFLRHNKRGFKSNNFCSINSKRGHKVVYIKQLSSSSNSIEFTIDLPWNKIEENYKLDYYLENTIFFIKKALQTSYMFKFTIVERRDNELESELI